jgi:hypothetical protein
VFFLDFLRPPTAAGRGVTTFTLGSAAAAAALFTLGVALFTLGAALFTLFATGAALPNNPNQAILLDTEFRKSPTVRFLNKFLRKACSIRTEIKQGTIE